MRRLYFQKRAFTLLELLIVVIIIGILASLAIPRFLDATNKAKEAEAKSILGTIRLSQFRYYAEYGEFNSSIWDAWRLDITVNGSKYYDYYSADGTAAMGAVIRNGVGAAVAKASTGLKNVYIDADGTIGY